MTHPTPEPDRDAQNDCRSLVGEAVGLLDAAQVTLRLAYRHRSDDLAYEQALLDLVSDPEVRALLALAVEADSGPKFRAIMADLKVADRARCVDPSQTPEPDREALIEEFCEKRGLDPSGRVLSAHVAADMVREHLAADRARRAGVSEITDEMVEAAVDVLSQKSSEDLPSIAHRALEAALVAAGVGDAP